MSNQAANPALLAAVIFDLDGVLTDTAEFHYLSWKSLADDLGFDWSRPANEALRGLGRMESLRVFLGDRWGLFTDEQRADLAAAKNQRYLDRVEKMTWDDLLPGAPELLMRLRAARVPTAVASSSKNARVVISRLGISNLLDVIVDGLDAPRSKPDPQTFLLAADRLRVAPRDCVVIEDAESGVQAALAAGMRVIGIGPAERVGRAHIVVSDLARLADRCVEQLLSRG
ncbi:MAG: beta-phosphoglucomutase [Phycisphaerales bacterium]|nr:beta-phosphoglucomutase [Phycisphaerales bacterium]